MKFSLAQDANRASAQFMSACTEYKKITQCSIYTSHYTDCKLQTAYLRLHSSSFQLDTTNWTLHTAHCTSHIAHVRLQIAH